MKSKTRKVLGTSLLLLFVFIFVYLAVNGETAQALQLISGEFTPSTSGESGEYGPDRVFDGSNRSDSFWEATGSYPFWLQIDCRRERTVTRYFLQAGEEVGRMPTEWRFEGSRNGIDWVILDDRSGQTGWARDETRDFVVSTPDKYGFYRLFFTAGLNAAILRVYEIGFQVWDRGSNFVIRPDGTLEWPNRLKISRSDGQGLPDLEDGRKRAQPGGALVIQPQGDWRRSALDLFPTNGKLPDVDALAEVTLHRMVPSGEGFEMVSYAALATENTPFGIIVESGGKGKPRPFVFWTLRENMMFSDVNFSEAFRITKDGSVQFGRKRGKGSAARVLSDDPTLNDNQLVDALFIEKQDPANPGVYDSNYLKIVAKNKGKESVHRHEWRINVHIDKDSQNSSLIIRSRKNEHSYTGKVAITNNGDIELLANRGAIVMRSSNGKRWRITIDNSGNLKTSSMDH